MRRDRHRHRQDQQGRWASSPIAGVPGGHADGDAAAARPCRPSTRPPATRDGDGAPQSQAPPDPRDPAHRHATGPTSTWRSATASRSARARPTTADIGPAWRRGWPGYFGRGTVVVEGVDATRSNRGAERIDNSLNRARPAYTLICTGRTTSTSRTARSRPPCFTIDSLRDIVLSARGSRSLPILSTIIPANPKRGPAAGPQRVGGGHEREDPGPGQGDAACPSRIRSRCSCKDPTFDRLYIDHVHPNNSGYDHIAEAFFTAITTPTTTTTLSAPTLFTRPTSLGPTRATASRPAIVGAGSRE